MYKTSIIGCGAVAGDYDQETSEEHVNTHVKAYMREKRTQLVAVADVDLSKAKSFSGNWEIKNYYENPAQMLEKEKPEIISVCTPDKTHIEVLALCLQYPSVKAVWCEKPIATSLTAAEAIVKEYAARNVKLAVNYQRRWDGRYQKIKHIIQGNELGKIQKAVVFYGKGVGHCGSHAIDLLLLWLGDVSEARVFDGLADYDNADLTLDARFKCGGVPVYLIGTDERAYSLFEIQIFGTLGCITINRSGAIEYLRVKDDPEFKGHRMLALQESIFASKRYPMSAALDNIIGAIETDVPLLSSGETALQTLNVCDHLLQLAKEKSK